MTRRKPTGGLTDPERLDETMSRNARELLIGGLTEEIKRCREKKDLFQHLANTCLDMASESKHKENVWFFESKRRGFQSQADHYGELMVDHKQEIARLTDEIERRSDE